MQATELAAGPEITEGLTWRVVQAGGGETLFTSETGGAAEAEVPPGVYDIFVMRDDGSEGDLPFVKVKPGGDVSVTIALQIALSAELRTVPEGAAPSNSEIVVYWEGPDREGDYIAIVEKGAREGLYGAYSYTKDGQPLSLRVPPEVGEYEVRYMLADPARALASIPLVLEDVTALLTAPDQVSAGSTFEVTWEGPGEDNDWITIVAPDEKDGKYASYAYPHNGNVLELTADPEPGNYEVRYVLAGTRVIARHPIEVTDVSASLEAPDVVAAGSTFEVTWEGPAENGDWVTIVAPDADERVYKSYAYPKNGKVLELKAALEPGDYEVRYVFGG